MTNRLYLLMVKYTNASKKPNAKFAAIADDASSALRVVTDAGIIGDCMSSVHITEADVAGVVIPSWVHSGYDGQAIVLSD